MKRNVFYVLMLSILGIVFALPAFSQTATVKGVCKDAQGTPIADAQVTWHNDDNGRTFKLKTNKKGEYFSLGVDPGTYTVTLSKDGKQLDQVSKFKVGVDEVDLPFDLKASQEQAVQQTAKEKGISPEQVKQMQEQAHAINPRLAFVPCCYYPSITPRFVTNYCSLLDGILFPYRHESAGANLKDPDLVEAELKKSNQTLEQTLTKLKLTAPEFRAQVKADLRWEKFATQQAAEPNLKAMFQRSPEMFDGSQVRARHILLSSSAKADDP